jgi:aldose sugar dehydrogenase
VTRSIKVWMTLVEIVIILSLITYFVIIPCVEDRINFANAQKEENLTKGLKSNNNFDDKSVVNDPNFKTELVAQGLDFPTTMAFLGQNDILVLEKDKGQVQRIVNGNILEKPLLDLNVSGFGEEGLLGISVAKDLNGSCSTCVFLYFSESNDAYYDYSLDVSARDVNQLHSKVIYYDSKKKEIGSDFIFDGKDGVFNETFHRVILLPNETNYLKLQMWVKPSLGKPATYLIDNVKIKNVTLVPVNWINNDNDTLSISNEIREPVKGIGSLIVKVQPATTDKEIHNSTWSTISTDFIGVNNESFFNYSSGASGDITTQNDPLGNRLYRYEFVNNHLINQKLLLDLPPGHNGLHNGGKLVIGPDNYVYLTAGDLGSWHGDRYVEIKTTNNKTGPEPDGTAGILRVSQNGQAVHGGILGSKYPLNLYYAYGIRNSYGIDFDPVTGNLWDTENGDLNGDEINLVKPGFNSGWSIVEGMAYKQQKFDIDDLVNFNGKGKYSEPEFAWYSNYGPAGPTAIKFLKSDKYGKEYENDMFVGDFHHGNIYHFDLDKNRTALLLDGSLKDKIASKDDGSLQKAIFSHSQDPIVDIQVGPDGYIYYISLNLNPSDCEIVAPGCLVDYAIKGDIFRIVPKNK